MERTPCELWTEIFAYACTDSGTTGRHLSLVSKFIRAASAPVKLQSIAVHGLQKITDFCQLLLQTSPHLRQVKYLLLSTKPFPHTPKQAYEQLSEACRGVLIAAAESVEILYLDLYNDSDLWNWPTASFKFPRLVELASHRFPQHPIEHNIPPFPQLRRWHCTLMLFGGVTKDQNMFGNMCITAPAITHVRFSGLQAGPNFAIALKVALPDTVQLVYAKPAASLPRRQRLNLALTLEELNKSDRRLVLLPGYIFRQNAKTFITGDWEKRINGGDGCWSLRERILADINVSTSREPSTKPHIVPYTNYASMQYALEALKKTKKMYHRLPRVIEELGDPRSNTHADGQMDINSFDGQPFPVYHPSRRISKFINACTMVLIYTLWHRPFE